MRIAYRISGILFLVLRISDFFPKQPGEKIETVEDDLCQPIVAEVVIFGPMVGDWDKENEVDGGGKENYQPGNG